MPTALPSSAPAHTVTLTRSFSKQRCIPGLPDTSTVGGGRCQDSEHTTPSSGAAKATRSHRPVSSAQTIATAAHVVTARVSADARQRNSAVAR
jgi:hypothetical protein